MESGIANKPEEKPKSKMIQNRGAADAVYGLGLVGAFIYYVQHAATFGAGVLGFLKALVWPAILVHKLLELLNQ